MYSYREDIIKIQASLTIPNTNRFCNTSQFKQFMDMTEDSHHKLMSATDKLNGATFELERSNAILDETISIQMDSLNELKRNREVLESDNAKLDSVSANLNMANRTLKNMLRRAITNKILLAVIAFIILIIILTLVYYRLFNN